MGKESKNKLLLISSFGIVSLWILAFVIPLFFKPGDINKDNKDTLNYYEVSFLCASALFTGIAFAATFSSLEHQKESLKKQVDLSTKQLELNTKQLELNIFCETMRMIISDNRYIMSRNYIFSEGFYKDVNEVCQIWNKEKKKIGLEDFRRILNSDSTSDDAQKNIDEEVKKRIRESYEMITYFCTRMELLGIVYAFSAKPYILDFYHQTIIESYKRLNHIIDNTISNDKPMYEYYIKMYGKLDESSQKDKD